MHNDDKPKVVGIVLLVAPLLAWFATAKLFYGFTPENARPRIIYLIKHTFSLWPMWSAMLVGELLAIVALIVGFRLAKGQFQGAYFSRFYRGTQLVSPRQLAQKTRDKDKRPQVTIGGVPMPIKAEVTHVAVGGTTGTGKSTIFKEMMNCARQRGDRMLILDPDGSYFATFGRPGKDIILNPYDARTKGWSFFNEIRDDFDYKRLASSLIQPSKDAASEEWNDYARTLFREVAKKLKSITLNPSMKTVYHWTNQAETSQLKEFCEGTNAQGLFAEGADRALGSTRFVLSNKLPPHLDMPHGDFSLRKWVEDEEAGNLYITWDENMRAALRPLISTWTDIVFSAVLGLPEDEKRRLWVFLDELESLEYLPNLGAALTKGRKKGLCVVTGWQTKSQIVEVYGPQIAETLLADHRSLVALGIGRSGHETAEHLSKSLGEHEVERPQRSRNVSMSQSGMNTRDDIKLERVVLPTEIMSLDDLHGYLCFPGSLPVAKIQFEPVNYRRKKPVPGIERRQEAEIIMPEIVVPSPEEEPILIEGKAE